MLEYLEFQVRNMITNYWLLSQNPYQEMHLQKYLSQLSDWCTYWFFIVVHLLILCDRVEWFFELNRIND